MFYLSCQKKQYADTFNSGNKGGGWKFEVGSQKSDP